MIINGNHIKAEGGKVFRRIADGMMYGSEIDLGYTYYIGGVLQDPPHHDTPEDFEEVESTDELTDQEALAIIMGNE